MANSEVQKSVKRSKKEDHTNITVLPEDRAAIGKHAATNGVSAASRYFSRKLKHPVSVSTVMSIKNMYAEERKRCEQEQNSTGREYQEIVEGPFY